VKDASTRPRAPRVANISDLRHLEQLIAPAAMALLGGVVCGFLIAHIRRRHGFGWSWGFLILVSVAALVPAILASGLFGGVAGLVFAAFAVGIAGGDLGWGIKSELEDRRAGGDREIAAGERRGLLDPARRLHQEHGRRGRRRLSGQIPVGRDRRGRLAFISRGSAQSGSHVLIPGATGAGKTTSLAALLVDYVGRSGFGAVILEAKNDAALLGAARRAAADRGVPFHLFTPDGPSRYDPLAHGDVDERSERLLAVESWGSADAGFYRQASSPFLRLVIRVLDGSAESLTLPTVASNCDPDELENLASSLDDADLLAEVGASVDALRGDQRRAVGGLRARLQNLASSEVSRRWLQPPGADDGFDLRGVIDRREVAYFRFDTDRTGNVGRAIAQMVLLDLGAAASARMGRGTGTFVGIDEFGALEAPALERLFTRGRAAGFSVALGTQTLADLSAAGQGVRERVGATISAIICHRIGEQADAEWVAQLIGAVPTWQNTVRTDGFGRPTAEGTRTRGYRFEVNPSQLQRLGRGEAYVARLDETGAERSSRVEVVPAWERLAGWSAG
jgi:hypothetical protein